MHNSILNIPNILTIIRILIVPFFIYFLFQEDMFYKLIALIMFIIASITDFLDGYIARKFHKETEFGKFLDPLADKILVVSSFVTFILLYEQIEVWMVFLIILRDMLITSLRYLGIKQGKPVKTTQMGKIKTVFQMGTIILILIFLMVVSTGKHQEINTIYKEGKISGLYSFEIAFSNLDIFAKEIGNASKNNIQNIIEGLASFLPYFVMLITTLITVLSGIRYLFTNKDLLNPNNIILSFRKGS